ncbi:MAG: hypothetical protein WAM17_05640 [Rhodoplanes sp.]
MVTDSAVFGVMNLKDFGQPQVGSGQDRPFWSARATANNNSPRKRAIEQAVGARRTVETRCFECIKAHLRRLCLPHWNPPLLHAGQVTPAAGQASSVFREFGRNRALPT